MCQDEDELSVYWKYTIGWIAKLTCGKNFVRLCLDMGWCAADEGAFCHCEQGKKAATL